MLAIPHPGYIGSQRAEAIIRGPGEPIIQFRIISLYLVNYLTLCGSDGSTVTIF